jgi:Fe-S-cluster containining protein
VETRHATRHGECNHCGWCCEYEGKTVAQVENPKGVSDPRYYRLRGFVLDHREGIPVMARRTVWMRAVCPEFQGAKVTERCGIYQDRPETCQAFPTRPAQIVGTPCSYWFERDGVRVGGGLGSPYPTEE